MASTQISELRLLSGLSWDELGQLFGVPRRTVEMWASGQQLSASQDEHLAKVLEVIRYADRGTARSNRAVLFAVLENRTAVKLLEAKRFADARAILGRGIGRPERKVLKLSAAAKAARMPLRPEELIDAQHERVHR